ncbi:MAG: hypothetical protein ACR2J5_16740 [Geodermatophilaceae bacterium]
MTSPDRPAPGEDIAKGSDGHAPGAGGTEPGDPDPRDPTEDASDPSGSLGDGEAPEPLEPPD